MLKVIFGTVFKMGLGLTKGVFMQMKPILVLMSIVAMGQALACSDDDNGQARDCVPGSTQVCVCLGSVQGVQVCSSDGMSWGTCDCGGGSDGGIAADKGSGKLDKGSTSSKNAPKIINLTASVTTITPTKPITITAIVTDPQGIADVIGGQLEHPGGGTYGSFATAAQEGAYGIKLTFSEIHNTSAINATPNGIKRTFRSRFYDVSANEATRDISALITCDVSTESICNGQCVNLQSNMKNCGKCSLDCKKINSNYSYCSQGKCKLEKD